MKQVYSAFSPISNSNCSMCLKQHVGFETGSGTTCPATTAKELAVVLDTETY
jgi:hypothetical protein